jgi:hypothetical protein
MFYRVRADMSELRCGVRRGGRDRWSAMRFPRPETLPQLPTSYPAQATAKTGRTPAEVARLRSLRTRVSGEACDRRKDALALPAQLLSRVLALRRPQHLESSTRSQVVGGGEEKAARASARAVSAVASKKAPSAEARPGRRVRRTMRRLRLLGLPRSAAVPPSRSLDEGFWPRELQRKSRPSDRRGCQVRSSLRQLPSCPARA